jgi:Uma2 family endonuclease
MTVQEMKERKRILGYSNEQLAALSGVPLSTVQKVLGGSTQAPRYETLQKLEKVLRDAEKNNDDVQSFGHSGELLRETGAAYGAAYGAANGAKQQGQYTLEDYYALPDERRVELIDGVFYDMSAPASVHQALIGELYMAFAGYVRSRKGPCKVFLSPCDVQLDEDDRTMVQPDLLVICDRRKIRMRCCFGAPDLVIEILSPSTRKKDLKIKTAKYAGAGVREYWVIDPESRQIMVIDFEKDAFPAIYGFEDKIPVAIWGGELVIDFSEISREIAYLYEDEGTE